MWRIFCVEKPQIFVERKSKLWRVEGVGLGALEGNCVALGEVMGVKKSILRCMCRVGSLFFGRWRSLKRAREESIEEKKELVWDFCNCRSVWMWEDNDKYKTCSKSMYLYCRSPQKTNKVDGDQVEGGKEPSSVEEASKSSVEKEEL